MPPDKELQPPKGKAPASLPALLARKGSGIGSPSPKKSITRDASSPGSNYRITKPTIASSQRLKLGTSPALVVKASKLGTAEKNRRARHNEDNRLVEEAKRQAALLIDQARQVSAMNDNKEMIRDKRRTEMAKGAGGKVTLPSKTPTTDKKQSSQDERGRTMERENSGKRSLLKTDSPKPHIGGKRPALATSGASKATPAVRPLNAHVNVRTRVAKPTTRTSEKRVDSSSKTAILPKQRSSGLLRGSPRRASWRFGQSSANRSEERKKAIIDSAVRARASAPSPEEHAVAADEQKPRLESMSTTVDETLIDKQSASRTPFCSPVSTPDLLEDLRTINQTSGNVRLTRYDSSSWVAPVYRPKTRRDRDQFEPPFRPRPIRPAPVRRYKNQGEEALQRPILAKSAEQSRPSSIILPTAIEKINVEEDLAHAMTTLTLAENSSVDKPNQSRPASSYHDHSHFVFAENISLPDSGASSNGSVRGWDDAPYNSDNMLPNRNVISPELSPSNLRAEEMSPIDFGQAVRLSNPSLGVAKAIFNQWRKKVSTSAHVSNSAEKIGCPFKFESGDATKNVSNIVENIERPGLKAEASQNPAEIDTPTSCDSQSQSLVRFNARVDAPQIVVESPSKLKEKSLQPTVASSPSSPSSRIPVPKEKFKRGGIKDVQWETMLPLRLKEDIPAKDELDLFKRSSSGTGIEASNIPSEQAQDIPDDLSNAELPPQTKALASCLTNSRRGRGLHVSFASSEADSLHANVHVVDSKSKDSEVPAQLAANGSDNVQDGKGEGPETSVSPTTDTVMHVKSYSAPEVGHTAFPRRYDRQDYERAKKGLRNAVIAGNLLLEKSSLLKPKKEAEKTNDSGSGLLHHAVSYIMAVKKQFHDQPEIYQRFLALLNALPQRELITPEQAKHVDTEVAKLLASAPDLVERFKMFRPCNARDDENSSEDTEIFASSMVAAKDANTNQRNTIVDSFKNIAHQENDGEHMQRLIESLRHSAKGLCYKPREFKPSHNRSTVPRTKKEHAKYNPAAPEFKPLVGAFLPPQTIPQWNPNQRGGMLPVNQDNQIATAGAANNHGPIFVYNGIRGVPDVKEYHTMPVRTRNRHVEALLKKEVLAAEMPEPLPLKEPMKMNGTTFYTLPKATAISPNEVPLAGAATTGDKEEFKVAFSNPVPPVHHGPFNTYPRNLHFGRNSQVPPLWMRTPLVPIRKTSGSKLVALHADALASKKSIDEHGIEVKRLDDETAKMKLDDFISRFPMTGRKAHVVPNMKQKYAAEIQHRLELVLYAKKEKEAAARRLLVQGLVNGTF